MKVVLALCCLLSPVALAAEGLFTSAAERRRIDALHRTAAPSQPPPLRIIRDSDGDGRRHTTVRQAGRRAICTLVNNTGATKELACR